MVLRKQLSILILMIKKNGAGLRYLSATLTTAPRQGMACSSGMAGQTAITLPIPMACSLRASNVR